MALSTEDEKFLVGLDESDDVRLSNFVGVGWSCCALFISEDPIWFESGSNLPVVDGFRIENKD